MPVKLEDLAKAGGKIPGANNRKAEKELVDSFVCRVIGLLADVPDNELRRKILRLALRRMLYK